MNCSPATEEFNSLLTAIHRGDWYWQVHVNEHTLQYHVWERGGEPLSEWRVSAAANIWPAREQRPPQTDDCWHCRLRRSDKQRGQVRMVKWQMWCWECGAIWCLILICSLKDFLMLYLKFESDWSRSESFPGCIQDVSNLFWLHKAGP